MNGSAPVQVGTSVEPKQSTLVVVAHPSPVFIPDHELLRRIGGGAYGEVWLARNVVGTLRAVKIVRRAEFDDERPYEREFAGIRKFEPISRSHEGFVDLLQVGRNDAEGCFYYVMELADSVGSNQCSVISSQCSVPGAASEPPNTDHGSLTTDYSPKTQAVECLRKAVKERDVWLTFYGMTDWMLDPVRSDPRFHDVLAEMRLK